jgi:hypothetical protein
MQQSLLQKFLIDFEFMEVIVMQRTQSVGEASPDCNQGPTGGGTKTTGTLLLCSSPWVGAGQGSPHGVWKVRFNSLD